MDEFPKMRWIVRQALIAAAEQMGLGGPAAIPGLRGAEAIPEGTNGLQVWGLMVGLADEEVPVLRFVPEPDGLFIIAGKGLKPTPSTALAQPKVGALGWDRVSHVEVLAACRAFNNGLSSGA